MSDEGERGAEMRDDSGEDVRVGDSMDEGAPLDDDSLFDGEGDPQYVAPVGTAGPARPGRPSSGNWRMPEWMADEDAADAKLGRSSGEGLESGGRSKVGLYAGVGLLVVALIAVGGVVLVKGSGGDGGGEAERKSAAQQEAPVPQVQMPPDKALKPFPGKPGKVASRVRDEHSGLVYPKMAAPWRTATKKNKLRVPGWSGQQVLVTERGRQKWYGQLLTGTLTPTLRGAYEGPGSVRTLAGLVAQDVEARYYNFPHEKAPLASQALTVDGHKGWLVASKLTYKRESVKATGEVTVTAVIDTGRASPAVVFASMPDTHKKRWPDLNRFVGQLKVLQ